MLWDIGFNFQQQIEGNNKLNKVHRFPGVIGAVDRTHIAIFSPQTEREHLFINRKQYHSLNVMIVYSYNNKILAVNAMHGERTHDAIVFHSSCLFHYLKDNRKQKEVQVFRKADNDACKKRGHCIINRNSSYCKCILRSTQYCYKMENSRK
ncbi:PREDICTED: uncharacterized protein LOC108745353 isoform X2 [Trachymyrmex septentrionalis]|uniref:uncharacterized protein LOC108745353 isoform X2 n=1 Tax=Trachymyrmex septentrionalis TaxID=34720 RepID=UPI00084F709C|nr:PREDICTED: uncharacterized protein LOC108745353 isoform X2 [Trachymyrmex septentrionalis]